MRKLFIYFIFIKEVASRLSFVTKCNKQGQENIIGWSSQKCQQLWKICHRGGFLDLVVYGQYNRLVYLRYTLPSLIISPIRFGSFYETSWLLRFTFLCSIIITFYLLFSSFLSASSPTCLLSNFSRYSYSLRRGFVIALSSRQVCVSLLVLSLWCLLMSRGIWIFIGFCGFEKSFPIWECFLCVLCLE